MILQQYAYLHLYQAPGMVSTSFCECQSTFQLIIWCPRLLEVHTAPARGLTDANRYRTTILNINNARF